MTDQPQRLSVTFRWDAGEFITPDNLSQIIEDLTRYAHDSLPGSTIAAISYDGGPLVITMKEES